MPVLDASACVALFKSDEQGHKASREWLAQAGQGDEPIVAPAILLAEVAAALGRGLGDLMLTDEALRMIRFGFVEIFPVTETLAAKAATIASRQRLRGCDSIYVALAEELKMELVTFDQEQLQRGAAVIQVRTP